MSGLRELAVTDYYLPDAYLALAAVAVGLFHILTGLCR